jgi:hypothetical protein
MQFQRVCHGTLPWLISFSLGLTPVLANIIFPLFLLPYVPAMLNPRVAAAALAFELVVFYGFQFRSSPFWIVVAGVIAANVISTVVGFLVLGFLPSPEHAPDWLVYPVFFVAWGVSVAIEYGVYWSVPQRRRFSHLFIAVPVSNVASYSVLGLALWYQTKA